MNKCIVCEYRMLNTLLDIGSHPISSSYLDHKEEKEILFNIQLGICNNCGLAQLINPVDYSELLPKYDWISFNEPEGHLDDLVNQIIKLPNINNKSKIFGISYKEDSTLKRFNKHNFSNTLSLNQIDDFEILNPNAGIESIQAVFNKKIANKIISKYGKADVLIVRHILEHANNPKTFVEALKLILNDNGYIIFEIPDCKAVFENNDYTRIWEDHIMYFTEETFHSSLIRFGFEIEKTIKYKYPIENSLIGIVKKQSKVDKVSDNFIVDKEINRMKDFSSNFQSHKDKIYHLLLDFKSNNGNIAIFGAGHLAVMFIQLMSIKNIISFVVDDHPKKLGMFMPGSKIPILSSDSLVKNNIKLCLSSLSPESEKKVIENNKFLFKNNIKFKSIFPMSEIYLLK